MLRNLMRAAVLCAALCALTAVSASSAFAKGNLLVGATPAAITGEQATENIFEVTNSEGGFVKVKCTEAKFEATTTAATVNELTVTPTYGGCKLGGQAATVRMNGCKYTFTSEANPNATTANVDIAGCTEKKTITVVKGNCTITVPEQTGIEKVTFANNTLAGNEMDVLITADATNIKYSQNGGSECPKPNETNAVDGKYTGTVTAKAFVDKGGKEVTKNEHTYTEVLCGTQVSLTVD